MNDAAEFAQEYSKAERVGFLVFGISAGAALLLASKFWLLPWLRVFAASAPCREVMGVSGVTVLWYGLFVGVPLFGAAVVGITMSYRGYRVLRDGQLPPVGDKVFRPTRIKRGGAAKMAGYAYLLAFVPFLMLAIWGSGQAGTLSKQPLPQRSQCPPSVKGTPHDEPQAALAVGRHVPSGV